MYTCLFIYIYAYLYIYIYIVYPLTSNRTQDTMASVRSVSFGDHLEGDDPIIRETLSNSRREEAVRQAAANAVPCPPPEPPPPRFCIRQRSRHLPSPSAFDPPTPTPLPPPSPELPAGTGCAPGRRTGGMHPSTFTLDPNLALIRPSLNSY